jgi:hypothetical protein
VPRVKRRARWAVVGGVYRERCVRPDWDEVFGSGGRAASALANMGQRADLYAYADPTTAESMGARAVLEGFRFSPTMIERAVGFDYLHGLDTPRISKPLHSSPIHVKATHVVRFGMLEGDAVVDAERCVYDPQAAAGPQSFASNGSKARSLALVLNWSEALGLTGMSNATPAAIARALREHEPADAVVIKMGPRGALVCEGTTVTQIPSYRSTRVWKIGSGDAFAAAFAYQWLQGHKAIDSAAFASKATAHYCQTRTLADLPKLERYKPIAHTLSKRFQSGRRPPVVYLAGPFFSLADLWMIREARVHLGLMGLRVFSPYHDVGHGSADDVVAKDLEAIDRADLIFAICDGLDSGTVYEVGYARSRSKPVVVYSENETAEALKMMAGSSCYLCDDFVSSIYRAFWIASSL